MLQLEQQLAQLKLAGTKVDYCCYGYAIDLLLELSARVNFTIDLHLVEDDAYGDLDKVNTKVDAASPSISQFNQVILLFLLCRASLLVSLRGLLLSVS